MFSLGKKMLWRKCAYKCPVGGETVLLISRERAKVSGHKWKYRKLHLNLTMCLLLLMLFSLFCESGQMVKQAVGQGNSTPSPMEIFKT